MDEATAAQPLGKGKKFGIAVLITIALLVIQAQLARAGITVWLLPLLIAAVFGYTFYQKGRRFLIYSPGGTRIVLGALFVMLVLGAAAIEGEKLQAAEAQRIVSLAKTNPAESKRLLAHASDPVLKKVKEIAPALAATEEARREAVKAVEEQRLAAQEMAKAKQEEARQAALAAKQEADNRPKIAAIEKRMNALKPTDYEGRITAYREMLELVPNKTEWAVKIAELESKRDEVIDRTEHPERYVRLENLNPVKGGFGSVMLLSATIKNESPVAMRDFKVRCEHRGPSGTVMDSNTEIIYERVPAGESKRVREVNMGFIHPQVATSSCEIIDASRG